MADALMFVGLPVCPPLCLLLLQAAGVRALAMVARGHVPYFGDFVKVEWVYSGDMICV